MSAKEADNIAKQRNILLIHVDASFGVDGKTGGIKEPETSIPARVHLLDWYCEWADDCGYSVFLLMPECLKADVEHLIPGFQYASTSWYAEDSMPELPEMRRHGQVWIVNGTHMPLINWDAARAAQRRQETDVLVFGSSDDPAPHYVESVVVDDTGEVVRFQRHYCDSPGFADLFDGDASFLITPGEHAATVATHVWTRGWGLESIGVLTRRYSVQWSSTACASPEFEVMSYFDAAMACGGESVGSPEQPGNHGFVNRPRRNPGGSESRPLRDRRQPPAEKTAIFGEDSEPSPSPAEGPARQATSPAFDDDDERTFVYSGSNHHPAGGLMYPFVKRIFDLTAASAALVVLSPFLLFVAVLIKCTSPGPVIFGHKRQGRGGKEFRCWKFRSMKKGSSALQAELRGQNEVDGPQFKIECDPRLTSIGHWLRRYNIDELPQLLNVVLGQMSVVGPRPSPDSENQLCPAWRRTRLSVKPGITGLWQVLRLRKQSDSDFQEWIHYDAEYARHRSSWLDGQIILHTPFAMFAPRRLRRFTERLERRGICTPGAALRRQYEAGKCR